MDCWLDSGRDADADRHRLLAVARFYRQHSTELIAQLAGGPTLYNQTFTTAYSDPIVQAAIAAATGVLTEAGATAITGPTQTSYLHTLLSSSSATVTNSTTDNIIIQGTGWGGPQTVPASGNFGIVQGYTLLPVNPSYGLLTVTPVSVLQGTDPIPDPGNNAIIPTGSASNPFFNPLGDSDANILTLDFKDIYQTTTNTDTYLTTTVYDLVGTTSVTAVPEPSGALILGSGIAAFALYRWATRRS